MKDKKLNVLIGIFSIVVVGGFIFLGSGWYQSNQKLKQAEINYEEKINHKDQEIVEQEKVIQKEQEKAKLAIQNNTNPASKQNEEMFMTIKNVFNCFYNFTPENYTSRESEITDELSQEMREQLFPQNVQNYQGTLTSSIKDIDIYSSVYYTKAGNKEAYVVIKYQTKYPKQEAHTLTATWKVQYDVNKKQITNIEEVEGNNC